MIIFSTIKSGILAVVTVSLCCTGVVFAQMKDELPSEVTLFKNVNIWDGTSEQLMEGYQVLVVRNLIKKIAKDIPTTGSYELDVKSGGYREIDIAMPDYDGYIIRVIDEEAKIEKKQIKVNIIDGGGRTLMPGLIEGHGHLQMNGNSLADIENNRNWEELAVRSAAKAKMALMSGFTSWRDMGGMGAGLKKSIDSAIAVADKKDYLEPVLLDKFKVPKNSIALRAMHQPTDDHENWL